MKNPPLKRKTRLKARHPAKRAKLPAKVPKPQKTNKSMSGLKKELDRLFSLYIRFRFPKECYTCRKTEVTLQCGHFIPRQYLATRWSEDNCRPQCVGCNIYGNGKILDFEERLKRELGESRVEELKASRHQTVKLSTLWYEEQIQKYKDMLQWSKILTQSW